MSQRFVKSAVIGHPVAHSKSPFIHQYWIETYGLEGSYEAIDIKEKNLITAVHNLIEEGYAGFNVTLPHKEAMLGLCEKVDETARQIGAVNTVVIGEDGNLIGSNTDAYGFVESIKAQYADFSFASGAAVVLGAGGAARAIVHGLLEHGCPEVILANRTKEKAMILAGSCCAPDKVQIAPWEERERSLSEAALLVNTTSLGMEGKAPLDIDLTNLPSSTLVADIVYAPLYTGLLKVAQERGNPVVTGIGMLLHQARPGFKAWHGQMPEVTQELEALVLK